MRSRRLMNQINVVPYIDVMLVLLVIFMVTAPMIQMGSVDLPSVADVPQPPSEAAYVIIDKDGNLSWKATAAASPVDMPTGEFTRTLSELLSVKPDQAVIVAADKGVKYDRVMQVLNDIRHAGFKKVGLQTESSHSGS